MIDRVGLDDLPDVEHGPDVPIIERRGPGQSVIHRRATTLDLSCPGIVSCGRQNAPLTVNALLLRALTSKLKLTVNGEKTRVCKAQEREFNFLGYPFGADVFSENRKAYLGFRPSKKSVKRMVETIHALTARLQTLRDTTELVAKLNRTLRGGKTTSK